jgi:hypothetical protein
VLLSLFPIEHWIPEIDIAFRSASRGRFPEVSTHSEQAYDIAAVKYRGVHAVTNFDLSRYLEFMRPGGSQTLPPPPSDSEGGTAIEGGSDLTDGSPKRRKRADSEWESARSREPKVLPSQVRCSVASSRTC